MLLLSAGFYDTVRREVVIHGGNQMFLSLTNYTWRYRTDNGATATFFGSGCAGSAGVPVLANVPYHLPWLGDTAHNRVSGLAASSLGALFVTSLTASFLPMSLAVFGAPGCDLLLPPDVIQFAPRVEDAATSTLAIPSSPSLNGVMVFQQAFPGDAAANPLGLTASNGLVMTVGTR